MIEEEKDLIRQRREKLKQLYKEGVEVFVSKFKRTHNIQKILAEFADIEGKKTEVCIAGRIMALRTHGKASFLDLKDGTERVQVYIRQDLIGEENYRLFRKLDVGDFIGVRGDLFKTRTGEITVRVDEVTLLSKSLRPLPEKWHGLKDVEMRYRQRYLDLIANLEVKKIFIVRTQIIKAIREFLDKRGYLEVETPMMQSLPGGAVARPFVTYHQALDRNLYLRIAPELYLKRLIIGGFEKVYEINRSFRNEGISTRHNPEFTMLEAYTAYADYEEVMDLTSQMFLYVAQVVLNSTQIDYQENEIDLILPWKRYSFYEALKKFTGIDFAKIKEKKDVIKKGESLGVKIERGKGRETILDDIFEELVQPKLIQPTFIVDYPLSLSPLAKAKKENPELAERFELFIGARELGNAYSELNDPLEQERRFKRQEEERVKGEEEAHMMDEDYLKALEYGMPPTGGLGIGIDRLTMLFTNSRSIREVILFPQMR